MRRTASLLALLAPLLAGALSTTESLDDDIKTFRAAIQENLLDDEAYATLVDKMKEKGYLGGDLKKFREVIREAIRPDEIVAHHRLEYALKEKGYSEEAKELEPYGIKRTVGTS